MDLSVVVPLFNEAEGLPLLVEQLLAVLRPLGMRWWTTARATTPPLCWSS